MAFTKLKQRRSEGFTLVELLIVIVVIAILAAITIIAYNGVTQKARTSQAVSAASSVQQIAEIVNTAAGHYPMDVGDFSVTCLPTKLPSTIVISPAASGFAAGTLASAVTAAAFTGTAAVLDSNSADSQHIGYLATTGDATAPSSGHLPTGGVIYHFDYSTNAIGTTALNTVNYVGNATATSPTFTLTQASPDVPSYSTCS